MNQEQELQKFYKQLGRIVGMIGVLWIICVVLICITFTDTNIEKLKKIDPVVISLIWLSPVFIILIGLHFGMKYSEGMEGEG